MIAVGQLIYGPLSDRCGRKEMIAALFEGLGLLFFVDPEATQWAEQVETSVQLLLQGLQQPSS